MGSTRISNSVVQYFALFVLLMVALPTFADTSDFGDDVDDNEERMHPILADLKPSVTQRAAFNLEELEINFWKSNAQRYLKEIVEDDSYNTPKQAKNVIMFLGDGMSLTTVAATRVYLGGEAKSLSFEKFPHFGLAKTYCVDRQVADSACTATAYLSGVKANFATIGLNAKVKAGDCTGQTDKKTHADSIAKWAQDSCKASGFVTTSRVTHASPSGVFAHTASRDWENDREVKKSGCKPEETIDIARQLIEGGVGQKLKVILGGGRREFRDLSMRDEQNFPGYRGDHRDLIAEWTDIHKKLGKSQYVWNKKGLSEVANDTEYLLGLFTQNHMDYNYDLEKNPELSANQPTLTEMTEAAIKLLEKEKNGYFLFVEGAKIDMAHHDNHARLALDETAEFSRAVQRARELTSQQDTLIVVTSDHSHTMTYNGYAARGSDILGLADAKATDKLPYLVLSYANGMSYYNTYDSTGIRIDLSKSDLKNSRFEYIATVPNKNETHGGEDVGIYASGPQSELFVGNYEQSYIPVLMAYSAKIGPYAERTEECPVQSSAYALSSTMLPIILVLVFSRLI